MTYDEFIKEIKKLGDFSFALLGRNLCVEADDFDGPVLVCDVLEKGYRNASPFYGGNKDIKFDKMEKLLDDLSTTPIKNRGCDVTFNVNLHTYYNPISDQYEKLYLRRNPNGMLSTGSAETNFDELQRWNIEQLESFKLYNIDVRAEIENIRLQTNVSTLKYRTMRDYQDVPY